MRTRALLLAALAVPAMLSLWPGPTSAQQAQRDRPLTPVERDSLERRVRVRMGQLLKTQLGLTDDQMRRLQATNARIELRRRALFEQEREVRGQLREAMRAQDTARSAEVSALLDRMISVQRQRVDLLEAEQRELATFLSPMQRARYFGMEEQIRRRVTEMRDGERGNPRRPGQSGPGGPGGAGGKRPPPPRPPR